MLDLKKEPCANCTFIADIADARVLQHAYIVLDEKLLKGAFAHTTTLPGVLQYSGLFGHTPLRLISPEEPLLIKIEINSPAWQRAMQLCLCQAGWVFKPTSAVSFDKIVEHLRTLFILDDTAGGKSFVRLQHPQVWTTLLANADPVFLQHWLKPLGRVFIPYVKGGWTCWKAPKTGTTCANPWQLTSHIEAALRRQQQTEDWLITKPAEPAPRADWLISLH